MALQDKYKDLIDKAKSAGISNLQVSEQANVLHINGEAPSGAVKDQLWDIYGKIDPDFRAGDVVMNVTVAAGSGTKAKVTTSRGLAIGSDNTVYTVENSQGQIRKVATTYK